MFSLRKYWFCAYLVPMFAACDGPSLPGAKGDTIVAVSQTNHLSVLDVETGRTIARPGPVSTLTFAQDLSTDSSTLYVFDIAPDRPGASEQPDAELIALDLRSLSILWREPYPIRPDPSRDRWGSDLAGNEILLGHTNESGVYGILAIDPVTRGRVRFAGPFNRGGYTTVVRMPRTKVLPSGAVVVGGTRTNQIRPSEGSLFILNPHTLDVVDSVVVNISVSTTYGGIFQLLPSADGRYVYAVTDGGLVRYGVAEHRVLNRVSRPAMGQLAIAPDGQTLYLTDKGSFDAPGSGRLYVFNIDLSTRPSIDLGVRSNGAVVSRDGARVYVAAGDPYRLGEVPGRVLVVDAVAAKVINVIPLDGWGARDVFLRP